MNGCRCTAATCAANRLLASFDEDDEDDDEDGIEVEGCGGMAVEARDGEDSECATYDAGCD